MASGSYFYVTFGEAVIDTDKTITADANISGSEIRTLPAEALIAVQPLQEWLVDKTNGETLQAIELRDSHSIALDNMLQWFHNGIGSSSQLNMIKDSFTSDNAFRSKFMYYSSGSYITADLGSVFAIMIECGSLTKSDFNINGCNMQQYDVGSYLLMGPVSPNLGSSRAAIMKTLFYGTTGQDPRAGSEYIYQLGSIKVLHNDFDDVGKRAYYAQVYGEESVGAFTTRTDTATFTGSCESSSGSLWSWSYVRGDPNGAGASAEGRWEAPAGTTVNSAIDSVSDETLLNTVADVVIDPGSVAEVVSLAFATGGAGAAATGSSQTFLLTLGSIIWNKVNDGPITSTSRVRDFQGSGVPAFGSFDTSDLLDYTNVWVQPSPIIDEISGSTDTVIYRWLGSRANNEFITASMDGGSIFVQALNGVVGSVGFNTSGSIIFKYELIRNGSASSDYVTTYGVYYG